MTSLALALALLLPQGEPTQPVPADLLQRIRERALENLSHLPNYTCRMTVERLARAEGDPQFRTLDRLRLDVAYVRGRELFAWPGASSFGDQSLEDLTKNTGSISNGSFATHLRAVFALPGAVFHWGGWELDRGRSVVRISFEVPQRASSWKVSGRERGAIVAYAGDYCADAKTLDAVRLEVRSRMVPQGVGVLSARETMEYGPVSIGGKEFLLPRASELLMVADKGAAAHATPQPGLQNLNRTRFDACHEYVGQSTISFGDPADAGSASAMPAPKTLELPPGVTVEVRLATEHHADETAIGDPVEAIVTRTVKGKHGVVLLPKGARLLGRITLARRMDCGVHDCWTAGILLHSFESSSGRGPFRGVIVDAGPPGVTRVHERYHVGTPLHAAPGEGGISVRGRPLSLPEGLLMVWQTVEQK